MKKSEVEKNSLAKVKDKTHVSCPFCGSERFRVRFPERRASDHKVTTFCCTSREFGRHGPIVKCSQCGFLFDNPMWTQDFLITQYRTVEDPDYLVHEKARIATFTRALNFLKTYVSGGRLLEIGCYVGTFLALAREAGFKVQGFELSAWAARRAQSELKLPVIIGDSLEEVPHEDFNVIVMMDVIEHIRDPIRLIKACWSRQKPGDFLFISTYDVESWICKCLGTNYPFFTNMHVCHFSRKTLKRFLEKCGYQWVKDQPHRRTLTVKYLGEYLGLQKGYLKGLCAKLLLLPLFSKKSVQVSMGLMDVCAKKI